MLCIRTLFYFAGMKTRILVFLGVVCLNSVAQGQNIPDSVADSAAVRLVPMTVSATRQSEKMLTVPLAITVVTPVELASRRGYSLDEALRNVPGVFSQSRYGTSDVRLVIRGFGARGAGDRSNAGTSRGVRVLLDGIPETEPDGRTSFDLIDLAAASRIEVIRSNASALYGNAAGGVVDISTAMNLDANFLSATQAAGSFGLLRTTLQVGQKIGEGSLALTFTNTSFEGWRRHSDARRQLVNAAFSSDREASTRAKVVATFSNDLFHIPGPLSLAQVESDPRQANATYAARDERRYNRVGRLGLSFDHDIDDSNTFGGMLFVNPKVLQRSERGTFRDFNRYHLGGNAVYRNFLRYNDRTTGRTVIGADAAYQSGTILFYGLNATSGRGTDLRDNKVEGATNTGLFAQHELTVGEKLLFEMGARYDDITYNYKNNINPKLDAVKSFTRLTPKLGASFLLGPSHSVYANIGGGIEAPAGNETDPAGTFGQDTVTALNPLLDAIRSTTYEVGTRNTLRPQVLGRGFLNYEVALYRTDVANEIIPYRGGRFYFTAGKVKREGAELGTGFRSGTGFGVDGSLTLSRNRFVRYVVDSVHYGRAGHFADYSGNDVPGVPEMYYGLSLSHRLMAPVPLEVRAGLRGVGEYFVDDANLVSVPSQNLVDLTVSAGDPFPVSKGWSVRGFVEISNLLDRKHIGSAFLNPDLVGGVPLAYEPGSPRTFVVSVTLSRIR
jgi:iron complex outermembrane recepter protein